MSEDTTEPSINITGVSGPTIDVDPELVVGSDSVWSAVVELCNSTAPPDGVLTVCVENVADSRERRVDVHPRRAGGWGRRPSFARATSRRCASRSTPTDRDTIG